MSPNHTLYWVSDQTPALDVFGEAYFSRAGGPQEKSYVFLEGAKIANIFETKPTPVIAELGFGTGLNFLLTAELWQKTRRTGYFHYISTEKFLLDEASRLAIWEKWPALQAFWGPLQGTIPMTGGAFRRVWVPSLRACLTLLVGDALENLQTLRAKVDAWYLDGFSPAKNPELWSPQLFAELSRLSNPKANFATYSAASQVRRNLLAQGCHVEKRKGFAGKREMLCGHFGETPSSSPSPHRQGKGYFALPPSQKPDSVTLVGAGIASASLCQAFARRGISTRVQERADHAAAGASGNPRGLLMPLLGASNQPLEDFFDSAFVFAQDLYQSRAKDHLWRSGVIVLGSKAKPVDKLRRRGALWGEILSRDEVAERAGLKNIDTAIWLPQAMTLRPHKLVTALLAEANVELSTPWQPQPPSPESPTIIAAGAHSPELLAPNRWPVDHKRGQISMVPKSLLSQAWPGPSKTPLSYGGYFLPGMAQEDEAYAVVGATYVKAHSSEDVSLRASEHEDNLRRLHDALPMLRIEMPADDLKGRAAIRLTTPDRMPIAGPMVPMAPFAKQYQGLMRGQVQRDDSIEVFGAGLWMLMALGSRGFHLAPLVAELLVSQILGEPWPCSMRAAQSLHPCRFWVRDLKRGKDPTVA